MAIRKSMLIDVSRCMACRGCQVACKQWNQLPAEKTHFTGTYQNPPKLSANTWTIVNFIEPQDGQMKWLFRKEQCLHCGDATCVNVCPTGAAKQREDGVVYIDQSMCTGCKYCVESCPFDVVQFDHHKGTARKCTLCLDRLIDGLEPACAKACPTGAIVFGDRQKIIQIAHQRQEVLRKENPGGTSRIYGEKELGGLGVIYLLPDKASLYGLPDQPRMPTEKIVIRWLVGVIPGLAILYGLWRHFSEKETTSDKGSET